jgi:predicted unusual protein kinase regulating ubiquinone biosynthesis (AarF/ABC1/UbiB family)
MSADQKSIPQGKLRRGSIVGATAAKVGVKKAVAASRRPFLSETRQREADQRTDHEIARLIFDALSTLRGTALKAAQLVSMEIEWLPDAYQSELSKAASQVPAMNRAVALKALKTELGVPERIFAEFSLTPFAAASLGQVHAATSRDGQTLAVKVQYPGIAASVAADIRMLKALLTPTPYARMLGSSFDEINRKLGEELDYRVEAANTEWFRTHLRDDRFVFPEVKAELSTRTVLTTSRIDGLHLDAWLATSPSQALRDHFGQLLVDFFNQCTYQHGVIHADPNPGNFLFRDDGRLGIIDFGCIKQLDSSYVQAVAQLMRSNGETDPALLEKLHNRIGIFYRHDVDRAALEAYLRGFADWLTEKFGSESFDFSESDAYLARANDFARELLHIIDRYDGSFIYFDRCIQGLYRLLQRLDACVRMSPPYPIGVNQTKSPSNA